MVAVCKVVNIESCRFWYFLRVENSRYCGIFTPCEGCGFLVFVSVQTEWKLCKPGLLLSVGWLFYWTPLASPYEKYIAFAFIEFEAANSLLGQKVSTSEDWVKTHTSTPTGCLTIKVQFYWSTHQKDSFQTKMCFSNEIFFPLHFLNSVLRRRELSAVEWDEGCGTGGLKERQMGMRTGPSGPELCYWIRCLPPEWSTSPFSDCGAAAL